MKQVTKVSAQGDVLLFRVEQIPVDAVAVAAENNQLIVTHSETGHHHAVQAQRGIELFQHPSNPLIGWLRVTKEAQYADVVHHRPWDTHETQRLLYQDNPQGEVIFEIRRQRERSPEGWRRVQD